MNRFAGSVDNCPDQSTFARDIFAKMPEGVLRPGGLALTRHLVDYCDFTAGARVVDIGCGTGITVEYLCGSRGLNAIGVDISDTLLQQGRSRSSSLQLIKAAGEKLPIADRTIDGVVAECSFSVMEDSEKVLSEVYRVLVPKGRLALTDLYIRDTGYLSQPNHPSGLSIMSYSELTKTLKDNGFNIILWEDQSILLKEFVARFIMESGSPQELWQCIAIGRNIGRTAAKKLGYFLLVAEKCER